MIFAESFSRSQRFRYAGLVGASAIAMTIGSLGFANEAFAQQSSANNAATATPSSVG